MARARATDIDDERRPPLHGDRRGQRGGADFDRGDPRVPPYADFVVAYAANVQPAQIVLIETEIDNSTLARALAAAAYRRGAKFVDVVYFDPEVKRARIEYAPEETLGFVPPWYGQRLLTLGEERGARIMLAPPVAPGRFDDLPAARAGRDSLPLVKER